MVEDAPLTLAYLRKFQDSLDERRGFTGWEREATADGFYAIQRVGDYTFAPFKVVWRYISTTFMCAVLSGASVSNSEMKPCIPNEKLMLIPFEEKLEAHYVSRPPGIVTRSGVR